MLARMTAPLPLLLVATTIATGAQEQVGRDLHPDPLFESVYCQQVANTLEDHGVGYRWAQIVLDRRVGKSHAEIVAIETRAFERVSRTKDAATMALQQRCIARLELAERQRPAPPPAPPAAPRPTQPTGAPPASNPGPRAAGASGEPPQVGRALSADPYFEALYCADVSGTFKDAAGATRWHAIASQRAGTRSRTELAALEDLSMDFAPLVADAEAKRTFEQCRARLAWLDAPRRPARSAANTYAPARVRWYDAAAIQLERDPVKRAERQVPLRAWNAYCVVAASSLVSMTARNAAAFGLDTRRTEHAQLLQAIGTRRDELVAQFRTLFGPDEQSAAREVTTQQLANYRRGLDERSAVAADAVAFAKHQFFECSDGFEHTWSRLSGAR